MRTGLNVMPDLDNNLWLSYLIIVISDNPKKT